MEKNDLIIAAEDAKLEITRRIDEFVEKLRSGTVKPDEFMTMSDIEKEWSMLNLQTTKIYSDIVSKYLSSIDEGALIKEKKGISQKGGRSKDA